MANKKYVVELTGEERTELRRIASKGKTAACLLGPQPGRLCHTRCCQRPHE